jgi:RNA polymerase-binding transcription factor DksA
MDTGTPEDTGADDARSGVTATLAAHRHSSSADHDDPNDAHPPDTSRTDGQEDAGASEPDEAVLRRSVDEIERLLGDVEAALGRLDDGTYGRCSVCGAAIDDERLSASPVAKRCGACDTGDRPDPQDPQDPWDPKGP